MIVFAIGFASGVIGMGVLGVFIVRMSDLGRHDEMKPIQHLHPMRPNFRLIEKHVGPPPYNREEEDVS